MSQDEPGLAEMQRKIPARNVAGGYGDGREKKQETQKALAKEERLVSERCRVSGRPHGNGSAGDSARKQQQGQAHVSETELLIAHVLAAMKDCSLFGNEDESSLSAQSSTVSTLTASDSSNGKQTSIQASAQTAVSEADGRAPRSSSMAASSDVEECVVASSGPEMAAQMPSQSTVACGTSNNTHRANRPSSSSLKNIRNKENHVPSNNQSLDMQDERAQPKFRNLADLYRLTDP